MEAPAPYEDLYSLLGADDSTLGWPEVPKDEVEGDAKDKALGTPGVPSDQVEGDAKGKALGKKKQKKR